MKEKGLLKVSVVGTKTNVGSVSLVVRHLNLGNTIKRFMGLCPTPNHFSESGTVLISLSRIKDPL